MFLALSNSVVVWCIRSAHPCVENKLRNAITETTKSVERCGRIQWEKETTVEMPVSVKGRASVNVQRLLEPLQMCRKRFWPGRKAFYASAGGIWWHVTNGVRFPMWVRADCVAATRKVYAFVVRTFRMIYPVVDWNKNPPVALAFSEDSRYVVSRFAASQVSGIHCLPDDVLLFLILPTFRGSSPSFLHLGLCLLRFHEENRLLERQNTIHENSVCITSVNFIFSGIHLSPSRRFPFARPDTRICCIPPKHARDTEIPPRGTNVFLWDQRFKFIRARVVARTTHCRRSSALAVICAASLSPSVMYSRYETEKSKREYQNAHKLPALAAAVRNIWWMRVYTQPRCQLGGRAAHKPDKFTGARVIWHGIFPSRSPSGLSFLDALFPDYARWNIYRFHCKAIFLKQI